MCFHISMSVDDSKPKVTTEVCPPRPESEELDYEPVAEPSLQT
jgi:hypothetical protein